MSQFDAYKLFCLLYYLVAPHRLFLDESQNMNIEQVFEEALNKLLSEGVAQLFDFQNLLLDVKVESGLFKLSRRFGLFCMLEYA